MKLAGLHGEHVEAGHGAAGEEGGDVVAADFEAGAFFHGHGGGLVRRFAHHGSEAEEIAVGGLVNGDFLLVLVGGEDADAAGHDDVSVPGGIAGFEDALARGEVADFDLSGKDGGFVVVEQFKEGNVAEFFGVAGHMRASRWWGGSMALGATIAEADRDP